MRENLVATLIDQLWNDPDTMHYRAAMRAHSLTEAELTALDRGIMARTLAANDAARQPVTTLDADTLPESLDDLDAEPSGEISPGTGRRQRRIVLDALRTKVDGATLDIPAMQARYGELCLGEGRLQAREDLLVQLAAHVEAVCPELTSDGQEAQVRLAANAVFAGTWHPSLAA